MILKSFFVTQRILRNLFYLINSFCNFIVKIFKFFILNIKSFKFFLNLQAWSFIFILLHNCLYFVFYILYCFR
ncbi:kap P-loop domain protein [Lactococcus lactis subsp. lactis IO-1]|nr:kap P-loop domain protein [Lactococcus lactis subsp. lactis IO-1]